MLPVPPNNPQFSSPIWVDGDYINYIDSDTGTCYGSRLVRLSCDCCSDYEDLEIDWYKLSDDDQIEIYKELGLEIPQE
jgi:hypothetical protein